MVDVACIFVKVLQFQGRILITHGESQVLPLIGRTRIPEPGFVRIGKPVIVRQQEERAVIVFQVDGKTVVAVQLVIDIVMIVRPERIRQPEANAGE